MFVAIPIMSFMVFVIVAVIIIIKAVKLFKNGHEFDNSNKKPQNLENNIPECVNEDIHNDSYHTYCDYCGATQNKPGKCSSCGAHISKIKK